jgi:hypothetical protein
MFLKSLTNLPLYFTKFIIQGDKFMGIILKNEKVLIEKEFNV